MPQKSMQEQKNIQAAIKFNVYKKTQELNAQSDNMAQQMLDRKQLAISVQQKDLSS
jgi:hypothetical protein